MQQRDPASDPKLAALFACQPLPEAWGVPECFTEHVAMAGFDVHLAGFVARHRDQTEVTGSAAARACSPLARAYFELLERVYIVEAERSPESEFPVVDCTGRRIGTCSSAEIFPRAPDGAGWTYSRSNGVAAGLDWEHASRSAELELVERDGILRAWYGETEPIPLGGPKREDEVGPWSLYAIRSFEFPASGRANGARVAGIFAFPNAARHPLAYGFGVGATIEGALNHARSELHQRLGFLWGEEIPRQPPPVTPTVDFHQETYLLPAAHGRLRAWLAGGHGHFGFWLDRPGASTGPRRFVDLVASPTVARLRVVKALPDGEIPLVFGCGHPWALRPIPEPLQVHPIA